MEYECVTLGSFWEDAGAKSTAHIPNTTVVRLDSPRGRDRHLNSLTYFFQQECSQFRYELKVENSQFKLRNVELVCTVHVGAKSTGPIPNSAVVLLDSPGGF